MQLSTILVLTMVMGALPARVAGQDSKAILVLHAYGYDAPGRFPFDTAFARTLREAAPGGVDLYIETLDPNRFGGEQLARTREYLRAKYAGRNIAAVAAVYDEALAFLLDEDDPLFPTVPVAALLVQRLQSPSGRVSAILVGNTVGDSLSLALRLKPQARQIVIIDGAPPGSSGGNALYIEMQDQIEALALQLPVEFLHNLPLDVVMTRLKALPPDAIIFFARQFIGVGGAAIGSVEAVRELAQVAGAPLFVSTDTMIGAGGVGGVVIPLEKVATDLARLSLRISEPGARSLPPAAGTLVPMFDWRELRRWGIDERLLPPGSEVRFREISPWDRYRWYVIGAVSVTLLQSTLIAGLVVQRARRRRTEQALRESEQRFRVMADTAPVLIWRAGIDKKCDFFNKPWLEFRGRTLEQESGSGWTYGVHPADRAACVDAYDKAFDSREPFHMEYRMQRADGEYRWLIDTGVPRYDVSGQFAGYVGSAIDITERKQIEELNHELAGRLINVQEEERARIARDLHDDVSQQLAGVAIMLSGLKRKVGKRGPEPDIDGTITMIQERTSALADAIRNLSHELHPSMLKHAGLEAALRRQCAEVAEQHQITVNFNAGEHLDSINADVALCLFRVAQEALANAVRHARARTIRVELTTTRECVELRVVDDGIGFVESKRIGGGLGLRSIDERVRLSRGHVTVESRPGLGTTLLVTIPQRVAEAELGRV